MKTGCFYKEEIYIFSTGGKKGLRTGVSFFLPAATLILGQEKHVACVKA